MGDKIFDVSGRAESDRSHWNGRIEIHGVDGQTVANGSFRAAKTRN